MTRIDALFAIEHAIRGESAARRLAVRRERSAPLVVDLEAGQEALDLAVPAVDRLNVQRVSDSLASRSVDALVRDVERRRDGLLFRS